MKANSKAIFITIILTFTIGIAGSNILGLWNTEGSKEPRKLESGEFKGESNPKDIKGSYSFKEISTIFNIPLEDLIKAFDVDNNYKESFKCKDLEKYYKDTEGKEIGTESIRLFVAFYKGMEYELKEDTFLPEQAVDMLNKNGKLSNNQKEYINNHKVKAVR